MKPQLAQWLDGPVSVETPQGGISVPNNTLQRVVGYQALDGLVASVQVYVEVDPGWWFDGASSTIWHLFGQVKGRGYVLDKVALNMCPATPPKPTGAPAGTDRIRLRVFSVASVFFTGLELQVGGNTSSETTVADVRMILDMPRSSAAEVSTEELGDTMDNPILSLPKRDSRLMGWDPTTVSPTGRQGVWRRLQATAAGLLEVAGAGGVFTVAAPLEPANIDLTNALSKSVTIGRQGKYLYGATVRVDAALAGGTYFLQVFDNVGGPPAAGQVPNVIGSTPFLHVNGADPSFDDYIPVNLPEPYGPVVNGAPGGLTLGVSTTFATWTPVGTNCMQLIEARTSK